MFFHEFDDRVEIFWVPTRLKILDCFQQDVCPGKFSEKFLDRDPKNFLDHDRLRVATGIFFWVATGSGRELRVDGPQH
jgi:hypothetical protein